MLTFNFAPTLNTYSLYNMYSRSDKSIDDNDADEVVAACMKTRKKAKTTT